MPARSSSRVSKPVPPSSSGSKKASPAARKTSTASTARALDSASAESTAASEEFVARLADRIGAHKFDMWFSQVSIAVEPGRIVVQTGSSFVSRWIEQHFAADLRSVASNVSDSLELATDEETLEIVVTTEALRRTGTDDTPVTRPRVRPGPAVDPGEAPDQGETGPGKGLRPNRSRPRRRVPMRRLDEFVVGPANRLAYAAARRLVEDADHGGVSPLFMHGDCGIGKTHLLQGICRAFSERHGRPELVRYMTGEQFTNEYIAAVRNGSLESFRRQIRRLELLAIDDVHFLSNKVRTQSEFLHTLDAINLTGARVVLASDDHPRHIRKFSQALVSRFLSGMVVQIDRPDRETRIELVQRLAGERSLPLNEAAIDTIASRCVGSVRELEGAVTKLAALRSVEHEGRGEVGLILVERLFGDQGWQPPRPIRIGTVVDVVCQTLGVGRGDLVGSSRHRRVVLGRGLVSYLGRAMTTHSYPEIARALGRSYHSTIHTAQQRLARQLEAGEFVDAGDGGPPQSLRELVDQLRHAITRAAMSAP